SRVEPFAAVGGVAITNKVAGDISGSPEFELKLAGEPKLKGVKQSIRIYCITSHGLPETDLSAVSAKLEAAPLPATPLQQVIATQATHVKQSQKFPGKSILTAVTGIIIIGIWFYYVRPQGPPAEPIPVAVVSFENQTGDASFDYLRVAIPNLLITSLEQSKYLRVTTWERLNDLLKQMGKENIKTINRELGFELCRREGIKAIVLGSFIKAGNTFATDVKVLDVDTKEILKSTSSRGEGVASILKNQIDQLSKEISSGVGLPSKTITSLQRPIREVTTTSMEAYDYFLKGRINFEKMYIPEAERDLKQAIALDSTMAMAYYYLGKDRRAGFNNELRDVYLERARHFSGRVTERERLYIESAYFLYRGDNATALKYLIKLTQKYPRDKRAHTQLGNLYRHQKQFNRAVQEFQVALELDPEYAGALNLLAYTYADLKDYNKALEYLRRYVKLVPGEANPYDTIGDIYTYYLGNLEEGIVKYKHVLTIKPNFPSSIKLSYIYCLDENYDKALEWLEYALEHAEYPNFKPVLYIWESGYYYYTGRLNDAKSTLDQAEKLSIELDIKLPKALVELTRGWVFYDQGQLNLAREKFKVWYQLFHKINFKEESILKAYYEFSLGLIAARGKKIKEVQSHINAMNSLLEQTNPQILAINIPYYRDYLQVELLLLQNSLDQAAAKYRQMTPLGIIPLSNPEYFTIYNSPALADVGVRVYLKMGALDLAIAEYERLTHFNPPNNWRIIDPRLHLQLAKLYEEKGLNDKAIEQFSTFLKIWKDADEDLPDLIDAKTRLEKLKALRASEASDT
ncbi:MAG: tetratricopeptide repeat protein, partial [Fidelibacterota bacterium]